MPLIEDLKRDHARFQQMLEDVARVGIASPEARKILNGWRSELAQHAKKEDAMLYAELRKRAADDAKVKWALDFFAKDLEQVSAEVQGFFARFDSVSDVPALARDYGKLAARLKERMRKEENALFPEYQRVAG